MGILNEIVERRKEILASRFSEAAVRKMRAQLADADKPRYFYSSLTFPKGWSLISEIKWRSPSRGKLIEQGSPVTWARVYQNGGTDAISVVTEENFFGGNPRWITEVKKHSRLPVLRKDFLTTPEEILESRVLGADAVLLIAAILEKKMLNSLVNEVFAYGMEPLVEVHNLAEAERALSTKTRLIGVNNRDLGDFSVDLQTTKSLLGALRGRTVVSESGIRSRGEIEELHAAGVKAFLVGEALIISSNPIQTLADMRCVRS